MICKHTIQRRRSGFILMVALGVLAILVIVATSASAAWQMSYRNTANVERRIQERMLMQAALLPANLKNLEAAQWLIVQMDLSNTALGASFIVVIKEEIETGDARYAANGVQPSEGDWLVELRLFRGKPEAQMKTLDELPPSDKITQWLWNPNNPDRAPLPLIGS
ncbi:hypothetical protein JXA32_02775 [Candidatus Sumerlaeota bacterium]|nr:hypothetical protein [Candidatus Sumerlaeota bacterium]